ncbi:MAG: AAA family ATPase [Pseudomonadales bacterium]
MHPNARRVLVVNGKGGCGKTTIATNLAVAYACRDHSVALIDNDPQAASTYWGELRSESLPEINVVPAFRRASMYETQAFQNRLAPDTSRIIVDGQSSARDQDLEVLIRQADVILVPLLPSAIDMHVGERFITELLTHRAFRSAPRPVAAIANRVQPNTETHHKLEHFLECLDVPCVATFRDSPVYTQASETGSGVVDMKDHRAARKECGAWWKLLDWIDAQPKRARITVNELRQRPKAAKRHLDTSKSLSA